MDKALFIKRRDRKGEMRAEILEELRLEAAGEAKPPKTNHQKEWAKPLQLTTKMATYRKEAVRGLNLAKGALLKIVGLPVGGARSSTSSVSDGMM
jgi:hypothetical protein